MDREGQAVTLLWLFTKETGSYSFGETLNLLIERANDRGEDVRQRCRPVGNLVETSMKNSRYWKVKLRLLRDYYESMSWPFEYDSDEIGRVYDPDDIEGEYDSDEAEWGFVDRLSKSDPDTIESEW